MGHMGTGVDQHQASALWAPAKLDSAGGTPAERFRHVAFAGECPAAPDQLRPSQRLAPRARLAPPVVLDSESRTLFDTLGRCCGIDIARYRASILLRRRAACLRALRVDSGSEAARLVVADEAKAQRALAAVMIGVTSFFRDGPVFAELRRLLAGRRGGLDALSVGCSDGAELYSVAMLLAEEGRLGDSQLWGVDCRREAIAQATDGVYGREALVSVPADWQARYFAPANRAGQRAGRVRMSGAVQVLDGLRGACRWVVADGFELPEPPALPGSFDLILCRNLAIYLTPPAVARLWGLLVSRLRPGGLLVVGKAERPVLADAAALTRTVNCIYQKPMTLP